MTARGLFMLRCRYCGAVQLRRARFRWPDWVKCLLLLRPCKCRSCQGIFSCFLWEI